MVTNLILEGRKEKGKVASGFLSWCHQLRCEIGRWSRGSSWVQSVFINFLIKLCTVLTNITHRSDIPFTYLPQILTSCKTTVQYHYQDTGIDTIHWSYRGFWVQHLNLRCQRGVTEKHVQRQWIHRSDTQKKAQGKNTGMGTVILCDFSALKDVITTTEAPRRHSPGVGRFILHSWSIGCALTGYPARSV